MTRTSPTIHVIAALLVACLSSSCSLTQVCPPPVPCPTVERCPTPQEKPSIVGTWETEMGDTVINFVFEASGGFIYSMQGTEVDRGQYALLETIDPPGINLIFEDGRVLYSIFEFLSPDAIRLQNAVPGDPRPISFSDALTFRRKSP